MNLGCGCRSCFKRHRRVPRSLVCKDYQNLGHQSAVCRELFGFGQDFAFYHVIDLMLTVFATALLRPRTKIAVLQVYTLHCQDHNGFGIEPGCFDLNDTWDDALYSNTAQTLFGGRTPLSFLIKIHIIISGRSFKLSEPPTVFCCANANTMEKGTRLLGEREQVPS